MTQLLEVRGLERRFGGGLRLFQGRAPTVYAVRGIDLDVADGETLGVVGESGCGKSTLARMLVGLDHPSDGSIKLQGRDISNGEPRMEGRLPPKSSTSSRTRSVRSIRARRSVRSWRRR